MNKQSGITPINRAREKVARLTNDTEWGRKLAYWIGKAAGGFQLRLFKLSTPGTIPWTPLKRPLSEATVALVTTSGVHCRADRPFALPSDSTYREIPRTASNEDLCITHERYDRRDAAQDINLIFPLERLRELEDEGVIGHVAETSYGFGFVDNPRELLPAGRKVGSLLANASVDLVVLVPA
ncbi:MAG TPA: glycine/sarcosine/betaine reductase selenoprotein B family protein [Ktedonobacteraceae bacterium]|jgi:D-proline reductase (dithiol) PrdB|nr:glycine/sarcosine/betaine reductase selenoprotein B family protein [Ktedonobacteraceae bacterium]